MQKYVSVLIPTWNGRHLLEKYLADNCRVLDTETDMWEIIIVDNGSTDGTVEALSAEYGKDKRFQIVALPVNEGFGLALNRAIAEARYPISFLLNNDLRLIPGCLKPLYAYLKNDTFAVYPWQRVINAKSKTVYGGSTVKFSYGMYRYGQQYGGDFFEQSEPRASWYASGAAALFSTEKLRQLGGFAPHYSPAYWEDVDLSHRAWQRGWEVLSVPTEPVDHWHESTSRTFPAWRLQALQQRNWWLFHWANVRQSSFWWRHIVWLPVNLVRETQQKPAAPLGLAWAILYIPQIIRFRWQQNVVRRDQAIIDAICTTATHQ